MVVLPTLSGLASLVHTATKDQYLAGIWSCDLPMALQWVLEIPDWRSTTYLAPTWSWAACKKSCPIMYPLSSAAQFKVKFLDAGVTLVGDNLFGRVSDGFLKLEGLVHRGAFKRSTQHLPALEFVFQYNERQVRPSINYVKKYDGEIAALPSVWCLQLCVQSSEIFPMQRDYLQLYGLPILEEYRRENIFRRLAYESCWITDADWEGAKKEIIIIK